MRDRNALTDVGVIEVYKDCFVQTQRMNRRKNKRYRVFGSCVLEEVFSPLMNMPLTTDLTKTLNSDEYCGRMPMIVQISSIVSSATELSMVRGTFV